jgi:predicted transcriptional regulator
MANVREMKAADIMHKGVETISSSAKVADALRKMKERKVSSLIVERRNKDDAYGILTKTDIVTKVIDAGPKRRNLSNVKVFEIMSKPLITVSPGLAIKYCTRVMKKSGVSRLSVFDGKQIVGILSMTDIFNRS